MQIRNNKRPILRRPATPFSSMTLCHSFSLPKISSYSAQLAFFGCNNVPSSFINRFIAVQKPQLNSRCSAMFCDKNARFRSMLVSSALISLGRVISPIRKLLHVFYCTFINHALAYWKRRCAPAMLLQHLDAPAIQLRKHVRIVFLVKNAQPNWILPP